MKLFEFLGRWSRSNDRRVFPASQPDIPMPPVATRRQGSGQPTVPSITSQTTDVQPPNPEKP
jgi:hypothetical protein